MKTELFIAKKNACYHCGDDCGGSGIFIDDKPFCCQGCKFVYELLSRNDLTSYYRFNRNPGINRRSDLRPDKFAILDEPEAAARLLDYSDEKISRITFQIPRMHCSSCLWLLENLNRLHPGIATSRVNFPRKQLSLTFLSQKTSLRAVVDLLASIGYEPEINLGNLEKGKVTNEVQDRLYTRLAVAGFCFANIMLFSFPEYFSSDIEPKFRNFFGLLKIALALPVFLYSSTIFFKSAYYGLRQRIINMDVPISLGILALFGRSLFELFGSAGIGYMDSFSGLVFFLLLGRVFQKKTYERLSFDRDYKSYFPISINKRTENGERPTLVSALRVGDRIIVRNGELVPADSVLIERGGQFDYSFVTGESDAIRKKPGEIIYAGGKIVGGAVELEVTKEVSESYLVELWGSEIFKKPAAPGLESISNTIGRYFTAAVILLALGTGLYWYVADPSAAINAATAVLIIACPCALALSTPFALGTAARILGRNGFFLKNSGVVEALAKADSVVFDKTGTLTKAGQSEGSCAGDCFNDRAKSAIKSLTGQSSHPLSRRIFDLLPDIPVGRIELYEEVPGMGISGIYESSTVRIGSAEWVGINEDRGSCEFPDETRVYCRIDDKIPGYFFFANSYRDGFRGLIMSLRKRFELYLLSGDSDSDRGKLAGLFDGDSRLLFNQSPYDKMDFINNLRSSGRRVVMLGDGLNDAASLKQSDIGIAVSDDTSSFSPAADAILESRTLTSLAKFISLAIRSLAIVKISFVISILYNIIGLSFAVSGRISPLLSAVLMPASSISVVIFTAGGVFLLARRMGLR